MLFVILFRIAVVRAGAREVVDTIVNVIAAAGRFGGRRSLRLLGEQRWCDGGKCGEFGEKSPARVHGLSLSGSNHSAPRLDG